MTAETRAYLRAQIDQARRAKVNETRKAYPGQSCTGCGCDLTDYTFACKHCSNRRNHRRRRSLEHEAERLRLLRRDGNCRCGRDMKGTEPVAKQDCVRCWDRQRRRGGKAWPAARVQ